MSTPAGSTASYSGEIRDDASGELTPISGGIHGCASPQIMATLNLPRFKTQTPEFSLAPDEYGIFSIDGLPGLDI